MALFYLGKVGLNFQSMPDHEFSSHTFNDQKKPYFSSLKPSNLKGRRKNAYNSKLCDDQILNNKILDMEISFLVHIIIAKIL